MVFLKLSRKNYGLKGDQPYGTRINYSCNWSVGRSSNIVVGRMNFTMTFSETEDFQVSSKMVTKILYWLDWWSVVVKKLTDSNEVENVTFMNYLFTAGGQVVDLLSQTKFSGQAQVRNEEGRCTSLKLFQELAAGR